MQLTKKLLLLFMVIGMTSCASIVSDSNYPLTINTDPSGATVSITNRNGIEIFKGKSPATVSLKAGDGFFRKAQYAVKISKEGFDSQTVPVNFKIDGWYFGNLLLGGVIGMLIIDPATGAMYKLQDEYINVSLGDATGQIDKAELKIYDLSKLPDAYKDKIVEIVEP